MLLFLSFFLFGVEFLHVVCVVYSHFFQEVADEGSEGSGGEHQFVLKDDWDANDAAGAACAKWCKLLKKAEVLIKLYNSGLVR